MQDFLLPGPYKKYMPIPSAISIPFYIGAPIAIDFCLGGAVLFFWRLIRPETAAKYGIVTGAGLMVGDGLWQLPFGILGIAKVTQVCDFPPFPQCMCLSAFIFRSFPISSLVKGCCSVPYDFTGYVVCDDLVSHACVCMCASIMTYWLFGLPACY